MTPDPESPRTVALTAAPLTLEQALRQALDFIADWAMDEGMDPAAGDVLEAGRATLDAARAAASGGVLREAAQAVVTEYDQTHLTHDVDYEDVAAAIDQLRLVLLGRDHPGLRPEYRAALASNPEVAAGVGLDVERLRAASDKGIAFGFQEAADVAREMGSEVIADALRLEGIRRYEALPPLAPQPDAIAGSEG